MSNFKFEHDGKEYEFEKSVTKIQTPGWLRKNRRRGDVDMLFTMVEEVAGEEALDAIDEMGSEEFTAFQEAFLKHYTDKAGAPVEKS